jgi:hypothetical protein
MHDLNKMYNDIVKTAQLVQAPYSEAVIKQMLATFPGFSRGAVQFRTTTKSLSRRSLDVRYEDTNSLERPIEVARQAGYLADEGRNIDKFIFQLYESFPYLGDGVDFDVQKGLTKLWFFPKGTFQVEQTFSLSAIPESVAGHQWFYDKYDLHTVYIAGVDYFHRSMNLYLQFNQPSHHDPAVLREMVQDLGFEVSSDEAINYSQPAVSAALTFNWESPKVERICFYVVHPNRAATPKTLHPLIASFVDEVPALTDSIYQVSWTFGTQGEYIKVENDYTGNIMDVIVKPIWEHSAASQ